MGANNGGHGGRVPQNLEWKTLMQTVHPDFVMFHNFKHQIARITMQKCGKRVGLFTFPKSISPISIKSSLPAENSTFFWQGHGQKRTAHDAPKYAISSEKFIFWGIVPPQTSPVGMGTPLHTPPLAFTKPSGSTVGPSRIPSRFRPLRRRQTWK